MHPFEDTSAGFAPELRRALARSGMSLAQVVEQLAEAGVSTTQATLSYWKSGRSLPRRASSRPIITELERILGLVEGTLIFALEHDLRAVSANRQADNLIPAEGREPSHSVPRRAIVWDKVQGTIDWSSDVRREAMLDRAVIAPDRLSVRFESLIICRIPRVRNPLLHVGVKSAPGERLAGTPAESVAIEGATLKETLDSGEGSAILRLAPPSTLLPGDMCAIRIAYSEYATTPLAHACERYFAWPLRLYSACVVFQGEPPASVSYYRSRSTEHENTRQEVHSSRSIPEHEGTFQISADNLTPCLGHFGW